MFRSKIKEKTWKTVLIFLVDSQWGKAGIASSLIQIQGIFLSSFWQVFGGNNFVGHRCTLVRQDLMTPKMFSSPTAPLCPANVAMYAELIFQCRTSTLPTSLRLKNLYCVVCYEIYIVWYAVIFMVWYDPYINVYTVWYGMQS